MKLVFLGTPQIAVSSLQNFINNADIDVVAVVTPPDKPSGRGKNLTASPIKQLALENNIKIFQPKSIRKEPDVIQALKDLEPDVFITFAFGQILSQEVLDIPKLGTVNLHVSLLPKYRGANPIQWAIINGDAVTGVTTMLTDIGVDTGDILLTQEISISEDMTSLDLINNITEIAPNLLLETVKGLESNTIQPIAQNHDVASHAPKLNKEDGLINWDASAVSIHNKVRGMKPWPSTFTYFDNNVIKITQTKLIKTSDLSGSHGEILKISKEGIEVSTGDGNILITKVQPNGKKEMDSQSWCNGARIKPNQFFINKLEV